MTSWSTLEKGRMRLILTGDIFSEALHYKEKLTMKNILLVFLAFLLVLVMFCQKGPEDKAQVEVIDGVTCIHNPETPLYPDRTVLFEEELSIGGEDESGNIILYQPSRYAVDGFGNIFISDRQESVIKKFDLDGRYLNTIGAKGEGPGEFQNITAISILPGRRLIVLDWRARRTSIFSADGEYESSYKWRNSHFDINLVTESTYTIDERVYKVIMKLESGATSGPASLPTEGCTT